MKKSHLNPSISLKGDCAYAVLGAVNLHAWIAFVVGVLVALGAVLVAAAVTGASYIGLAIQTEITLAVIALVIALILSLIFYTGVKAQFKQVATGKEALIGATGITTTNLTPKGEVRVMSEFWQATAKEGTIAAGQTITVVEMSGNSLVVQPAEHKA